MKQDSTLNLPTITITTVLTAIIILGFGPPFIQIDNVGSCCVSIIRGQSDAVRQHSQKIAVEHHAPGWQLRRIPAVPARHFIDTGVAHIVEL